MAQYWGKGMGLEVYRYVLFGNRTAGLNYHERQSVGFWGIFFLLLCCILVLLLKPSCFYKSCLLGARSFSFAEEGDVAYTVSNGCNYRVGLVLM